MSRHVTGCLFLTVAVLVVVAAPAPADNVSFTTSFSGTGPSAAQMIAHQEAAPYTGNAYITATNTGPQPWGDFHFQIVPVFGNDVTNVDLVGDPPHPPTSSQSPLTWTVDNTVVGATLDLRYYGDPVLPGATATFTIYYDNRDHLPFFGLWFYPTPVPEPGSLAILGLGVLLLRRR